MRIRAVTVGLGLSEHPSSAGTIALPFTDLSATAAVWSLGGPMERTVEISLIMTEGL